MTVLEARFGLRAGALALDVELEADERGLVLVGPNGAGKTTALLTLLGARRPERGRIRVGDVTLLDVAGGVDRAPEERGLAYLPQDYALFPHLNAADNVAFALRGPRAVRRRRAIELLERLGVAALAGRAPRSLSGGERQRVALARALAVEPRALLLDEPLGALDVEARGDVRAYLAAELRGLGRPFIVVTHEPADAVALGAPVAVLEKGRISQRGEVAELRAAPTTPFVARFFGGEA